ncbi:hypothetical protein GJ700_01700 [Duganella sp. FT92W]|uniref:Class II aldolase/adducin N-terminal domain-containing protein n=2 Tax=Pseudoduganella rivuli TaxID=2666085 RepID=A0A7X2III0_9BURK|nr:hypothetical protein [Pseudoduganella rivuli]
MPLETQTREQWLRTRDRLLAKGLLGGQGASLSVRCPGGEAMWVGAVGDRAPLLAPWSGPQPAGMARLHAQVYAARPGVGAVAWGGGDFGACLADFGGLLPQVFDEQARHIGPMASASDSDERLGVALRTGGNALLWRHMPLCMGTTSNRLALNVELFEKCAKAYVLAVAAGGKVKPLPWLVRHVANGRMTKDQRNAAAAFARGQLPVESSAY